MKYLESLHLSLHCYIFVSRSFPLQHLSPSSTIWFLKLKFCEISMRSPQEFHLFRSSHVSAEAEKWVFSWDTCSYCTKSPHALVCYHSGIKKTYPIFAKQKSILELLCRCWVSLRDHSLPICEQQLQYVTETVLAEHKVVRDKKFVLHIKANLRW